MKQFKKKMLFYNGQLFMGGIERVAVSYINELAKDKDIDLTVVIKENNSEKNVFAKQLPDNINLKFIKPEKIVKFREKASKNKKNIFWNIVYLFLLNYERIYMKRWLKRLNRDVKYDYVIDFDMSLGKYIQVLDGYKLGWVHYTLSGKQKNKRKSERFRKRLYKYDKIIVICDEMKNEIRSIYNLSAEKVERLYNPFNMEAVKPETFESISEEDQKLLEDNYMIGVSRLVKEKGRLDLIEIYSNLKKKYGIKQKLYILGDGEQKEELEARIKQLNLENDILLLGQKINPFIWMERAQVFLHPSYGEGLPTVFLESMILGTPVIAYDCPTGPKDILNNNRYGILVEMGNKVEFEEKTIEFLRNKETGKIMLKRFHEEKLNEFMSNNIIRKLKIVLGIS